MRAYNIVLLDGGITHNSYFIRSFTTSALFFCNLYFFGEGTAYFFYTSSLLRGQLVLNYG